VFFVLRRSTSATSIEANIEKHSQISLGYLFVYRATCDVTVTRQHDCKQKTKASRELVATTVRRYCNYSAEKPEIGLHYM